MTRACCRVILSRQRSRRDCRHPRWAVSQDEHEDNTRYIVVVNHEEQYSIWPEDREIPLGWKDAGKRGTKAECLAYIEEVWTDMRPLSLRIRMAQAAADDDRAADSK